MRAPDRGCGYFVGLGVEPGFDVTLGWGRGSLTRITAIAGPEVGPEATVWIPRMLLTKFAVSLRFGFSNLTTFAGGRAPLHAAVSTCANRPSETSRAAISVASWGLLEAL